MCRTRLLRTLASLVGGICILLVLAAPLPGEVEGRGCGGESDVEVDYVSYCIDKCRVKATKEGPGGCDIFRDPQTGKSLYTEDQLFNMCLERHNGCIMAGEDFCIPRCEEQAEEMCPEGTYWRPYISVAEAEDCLEALESQPCDQLRSIPQPCTDTALCDEK